MNFSDAIKELRPNYQTMKRLVDYCKNTQVDCVDLERIWKESKNATDTY